MHVCACVPHSPCQHGLYVGTGTIPSVHMYGSIAAQYKPVASRRPRVLVLVCCSMTHASFPQATELAASSSRQPAMHACVHGHAACASRAAHWHVLPSASRQHRLLVSSGGTCTATISPFRDVIKDSSHRAARPGAPSSARIACGVGSWDAYRQA